MSYPQPAMNQQYGGYPQGGAHYPPPQGGQYPHPQGGQYPPPQGGQYPPPMGYPPGQGGYPQPGYPPPQGGYAPQHGGYAPQHGGYAPQGAPGGFGYPPHQQQVIGTQPMSGGAPGAGGWMNMPQGIPNCPPGLEYLTMIDQLLIHQKVELLEAFTGFETCNKFTIKNSAGQKIYHAVEDSDCLTRNCCGPIRPFDMKILDNYKQEVIHLNRALACDSCFFPCCLQRMEVSSPPGTLVGSIEQTWSILTPQFNIKNAAGDTVLKIEGPFCTFSICGDVEFKVLSKDGGSQVGKISKQWAGLLREAFTDTDYFGITFPVDLDVRMKAVMLGACFLIDAMFFEKAGNQERDGLGML